MAQEDSRKTKRTSHRFISSCLVVLMISFGSADAGSEPVIDNRPMGVIPMGAKFDELLRAQNRDKTHGRDHANFNRALPPASSMASEMPSVGDQGHQQSCGAWAVAYYVKSFMEAIEEGWSLRDTGHIFSPAYVYNQIAGRRGTDTGMYIPEALNILQESGCASLAQFPYNPNDFRTQPADGLKRLSSKYRILRWKAIDFTDRNELKSHLYSKMPVIVAVEPDINFVRFRGNGTLAEFVSCNAPMRHAVCVVGYDDSRAAFQIVNSWGRGWGDGGFAWIDYDTFTKMCSEAYIMYDAPNNSVPPPAPIPAPIPPPAPAPEPAPQPRPVPPQPIPTPPTPTPDSSPGDSWCLVVSRSGKPWMLKLDGSRGTALADVQLRSEPRIRNGLIAFAAEGPEGRGVYVMSAHPNAPLRKLPDTDVFTTPNSGIGTFLAISPDATQVVFSGSNPGDAFGSFNILVQNVDGTEQRLIHRDDHGHHGHYCWNQPTRILFWRSELLNAYVPRIYAMTPDGEDCTRLTSEYSMWPDISPNLSTVAYTEDHQGREHLVVANSDFSNPSPVPGAAPFEKPRWHPRANVIFALNTSTNDIYRIDAKTGNQERITYWGDVGSVDCGQVSVASLREQY